MKRILALLSSLLMALSLLSGCAEPKNDRYTATYYTLFDTVTTVTGSAGDEAAFRQQAQELHDALMEYHRLFDIYREYEGLNNLKTVNDNAGIAPVEVDRRIIALLKDCAEYCEASGGACNPAMGSVLQLWHEAREDSLEDPSRAYLPDAAALREASLHTDLSTVILNEEASTVYLSDPGMRLDVGAVAKGWAAQAVAEHAPDGLLINIGGNVCATGPKDADGSPWIVGIRDPKGSADSYLLTVPVTEGSVVTSGDYQRAYWAEGRSLHHIIDPETGYPADRWSSVTVLCGDSGAADFLSTALFVLPPEEGQALLERWDAEAIWVDPDGNVFCSDEKLQQ